MSSDSYYEILSQVRRLTPEEQLQLIEDIIRVVRHRVEACPLHSVLEFDGFAKSCGTLVM